MNDTERVIEIYNRLNKIYDIREIEGSNPYRVLIRTILSQRTRDENTDQASRNLFSKYPTIGDVVDAPVEDVEDLIRPAGFYRVKARRIQEVSRILLDEYGGVVPDSMGELLKLPGVGRKTANCVLVFAFHAPAIPVDTHVHRISNRWGLVSTSKPEDTELALMDIVPRDLWVDLNDITVQFGQTICKPISPLCGECPLTGLCSYDPDSEE